MIRLHFQADSTLLRHSAGKNVAPPPLRRDVTAREQPSLNASARAPPMTYSVKELQERYGVGEHTILGWIKTGELRATNVARKTGTRPKWRISPESLAEFELHRESGAPPVTKAKRKQKANPEVIAFY